MVYGQPDYGFEEGVIVTKEKDAIQCFLELAITYEKKIAYKISKDGEEKFIPTEEVWFVKSPSRYLENIKLGKRERLVVLMVDGKVKLFNHVRMQEGIKQEGINTPSYTYSYAIIVHAVKKEENYYEINKKKLKERSREPQLFEVFHPAAVRSFPSCSKSSSEGLVPARLRTSPQLPYMSLLS